MAPCCAAESNENKGGGGFAASPPVSQQPPADAASSFPTSGLLRLAQLVAAPSKEERRRQLRELGVTDESFVQALEKSVKLCRRGIKLYPEPKDLAVSFNGGKDACVVLYLWMAARAASSRVEAAKEEPESVSLVPQPVIFFDSSDEFAEVRDFVSWATEGLQLEILAVEGQSFKQGMVELVAGGLRAVVMGQRRGDPWMDDVDVFSPSSEGWPAFMRVNPIIDWSYAHVWTFLRAFSLPYCNLYDAGYSSLGSVKTTFRNPALRKPDGSYAPAYMLKDASMERSGRLSRSTTPEAEPKSSEVASSLPDMGGLQRIASDEDRPRRATIIVVGNEILSGKVHDRNAHYLCTRLHSFGVAVPRILTVPDDIQAIAAAVAAASVESDFVFTSGGLGPTHDDVTIAGVASAFKCRLVQDEKLYALLAGNKAGKETEGGRLLPRDLNAVACHKMAAVPEGAKVEWLKDGNPWPVVSMNNVSSGVERWSSGCAGQAVTADRDAKREATEVLSKFNAKQLV
eukprot:TRINITY_DN38241_c0_g1_i1.p1 TRINITY_DN38241_c0_g1~~TRINITY_DN38241_c0_g1_i1.p1  ORF type:complete len:549 (+),score=96.68 TRINITY_DN38241_c0_g1_i1:107-1648(+)